MTEHHGYAAIGIGFQGGEESTGADLSLDLELLIAKAHTRSDPTALTVEQLVGRAILRVRLYFGWSQQELGRRARVSQSTISRLERGVQRGLSIRRLFAVLRALRVAEVDIVPRKPVTPPTALEVMLYGDRWAKAVAAADERLSRRRSA
jgi:transcriptional regulator with XRE-family HTH domain